MECVLCYDKIEEGMGHNKWRCTHIFHKKCIIDWEKSYKSCPVCRCEDINYENTEISEEIMKDMPEPIDEPVEPKKPDKTWGERL